MYEVCSEENNNSCTSILVQFCYVAMLPFLSTGKLQVVCFPRGAVLRTKGGNEEEMGKVRWSFRVCSLGLLTIPHINDTLVPKWKADIILCQRHLSLLLRFLEDGSERHLE